MTERPQLSVVGGGKGEALAQPTASTHLESRLAADLRAQRELNADLTLDLGAARAAVALAARRHEDLLTQLELEREARRQMKLQVRERDAEARALADKLRMAETAGEAILQDNLQLAARAEAAEALGAGLAQQFHASSETIDHLKGLLASRDEQIAFLRVGMSEQTAKQEELGERIALVLVESEKATTKARAAVAANADLTAQVGAFVAELSETLNVKDEQALDQAQATLAPIFSAITARALHLYDACAAAQADIAALRAEKAAIGSQLAYTSAQLEETNARLVDMTTKADNRFVRLTRQAEELAALGDALVQRDELSGKLEASLKERDAALDAMRADRKRLWAELDAEQTRASHLAKKLANKEELLTVAIAQARQREAELRQEIVRAGDVAGELAKKVEAIGLENGRLAQAEQALRAELTELNTLLDERRKTIRQLQQELALIKLGRKKALPQV